MIKGFNSETAPLTEQEEKEILPIVLQGLKKKIGKANAVTNRTIVQRLNIAGHQTSEPRIRKIINHIRMTDLLPGLIATSGGYFIATSEAELLDYEQSLLGREDAIKQVRLAIARQRRILYNDANRPAKDKPEIF